jgi:hypothetical protein
MRRSDQPPAVSWAPDSSKLVTYRIDSRRAGRFPSIQFVSPDQLRPRAYTVVYPLPGEALPEAQPVIFDMPSGKRIDVQSPGLELPFQDGPEFDWFPDSKTVFYDYDERGFKSKEIRIVDAETGGQKVLVREHAEVYVDPGETFYRFDQMTGEMLLTSERDGWNHLYLYEKPRPLPLPELEPAEPQRPERANRGVARAGATLIPSSILRYFARLNST